MPDLLKEILGVSYTTPHKTFISQARERPTQCNPHHDGGHLDSKTKNQKNNMIKCRFVGNTFPLISHGRLCSSLSKLTSSLNYQIDGSTHVRNTERGNSSSFGGTRRSRSKTPSIKRLQRSNTLSPCRTSVSPHGNKTTEFCRETKNVEKNARKNRTRSLSTNRYRNKQMSRRIDRSPTPENSSHVKIKTVLESLSREPSRSSQTTSSQTSSLTKYKKSNSLEAGNQQRFTNRTSCDLIENKNVEKCKTRKSKTGLVPTNKSKKR